MSTFTIIIMYNHYIETAKTRVEDLQMLPEISYEKTKFMANVKEVCQKLGLEEQKSSELRA